MQTQSFENSQHFQGKHILAWLILNFLMNVIAKKSSFYEYSWPQINFQILDWTNSIRMYFHNGILK